ncbi:MAG: Co2+/Mg2+ efflux protein ApaG [Henriciella sp.]|jgi:ApaG protein|uniref:Co2+/Mg2+ efflux protein ApaG n=1 Tax=Henriciella sp. TaxID=1968823 RepID=UPI000C10CA27|nr:Co2+/Mg2+ efflux protein ApaG [Henriciella sp.]MBF34614.1 Co2+/Mg2+ efflux protein ApaG [Hyphomonadaceae bacterium]MBK76215.1 Co2+/Mg2+ efflux protein ApaG [Henriciella sp.]PHR71548.1 MAG: Co2+/Mg2+ efflux protein ApaG [Henriciella sp.]|tara:strand:+ start:988 stop:1404 length:417 start_codon:yes stop_codon:yes gene_type:complete
MTTEEDLPRYEAVTQGMKISVTPAFLEDESKPASNRYVWAYTVEIENDSDTVWTLRLRHWDIIDSLGRRQTVDGEGVVGQTPRLEPGESFRYSSGAPLAAPSGMMSGTYTFVSDSDEKLLARVPAFSLDSPYDRARPS